MSHKPGSRLPLLSTRPAVTSQPLRGLLPISLVGKQSHDGCEQLAQDCYPTLSRLRFEPGPFCTRVQHASHTHSLLLPDYGLMGIFWAFFCVHDAEIELYLRENTNSQLIKCFVTKMLVRALRHCTSAVLYAQQVRFLLTVLR